jgi:hypothetical protein
VCLYRRLGVRTRTARLVAAILVFVVSVTAIFFWVTSRKKLQSAHSASEASSRFQIEKLPPPRGWKKIDVAGKLTVSVPPDMEPSEVLGDSCGYRKAFKNADIRVSIGYDEPNECSTPAYLLERPTYSESTIAIDGRNAKLGVDSFYQPESTTAYLCILGTNGSSERLKVSAICLNKDALATALRIVSFIRFNDRK